jgi:hypothetical protein
MMGGYYRAGDRIGCAVEPRGHSSLKKSGVLNRQWCLKCGYRCWVYDGGGYKWIHTKHLL